MISKCTIALNSGVFLNAKNEEVLNCIFDFVWDCLDVHGDTKYMIYVVSTDIYGNGMLTVIVAAASKSECPIL